MKQYLFICICVFIQLSAYAQSPPYIPPPPPGYQNAMSCIGPGAGTTDSWVAYFNDNGVSTTDCISDDWVVFYFNDDGTMSYNTSYNPNCQTDPTVPCYTNIDFGYWNCCPLANGGGVDPLEGGGSLECFMLVACESCSTVESWVHCLTHCSGCE